jgi:hypothetical protein
MGTPLDDAALDVIFRGARSQNKWRDDPVSDEQLLALYDLMRWGPTSANSFPLRIMFVKSPAAKERLKALVLAGNQPKVAAAPVTAILGYDTQFYELLPRLFPHTDARSWFVDKPDFAEASASATAVCKGRTLSSRRGRSGSTRGRCPASTTRRSTGSSSPAGGSSRTSCARWGTATRRACSSGCPARPSARCARSCRPLGD